MRNKKAKALRKKVYGPDGSPKFPGYTTDAKGTVHADGKRKAYQRLKRDNGNC